MNLNHQPQFPVRVCLLSLHGLIRGESPELGRDSDTGGQVKYVLELASALARRNDVSQVELITRQIFDERVSNDYARLEELLSPKAKIVRLPFGPRRYLRKEALWPYLDLFVDQCLLHFRRTGMPHLIHGHYADAGYAGHESFRLVQWESTGIDIERTKEIERHDGLTGSIGSPRERSSLRDDA